jgi:hypothetical protein
MERALPFSTLACAACLLVFLCSSGATEAHEPETPKETELGWVNMTDLGLTVTDGNSEAETLRLNNLLRWRSERASFRLRLDGLVSDTADDRLRTVDPGFTWEPGAGPPPEATTTLVDPDKEPDLERYYAEARYERSTSRSPRFTPGTLSWHAGLSWERDIDAGLVGRTVLFAGVGHVFWNREDLRFENTYSLSYTDRDERVVDPDKEEQFTGLRYHWLYENHWGRFVIYRNDWSVNVQLSDFSDYSSSMTQSISLPMSERLSLRVSLQWLFNSRPALEDIDVVAEVVLVDPDGIPGSDDEFFETVDSGGILIELGTVPERKESLDTVFTTSLTIRF